MPHCARDKQGEKGAPMPAKTTFLRFIPSLLPFHAFQAQSLNRLGTRGDEAPCLLDEPAPFTLGTSLDGHPLFHEPSMSRIEALALPGCNESLDPLLLELHDELSSDQHGEDLAANLEAR
jgi:hypothetical protein